MQLHPESHVERESARMCCLTLSKSLELQLMQLSYFSVLDITSALRNRRPNLLFNCICESLHIL